MSTLETVRSRFLIAGTWGGTGATETGKLVAKEMDLPRISGGKFFRAIANEFDIFHRSKPGLDATQAYEEYLAKMQDLFDREGLAGVLLYLEESITKDVDDEIAGKFQEILKAKAESTGKLDTLWDFLTDQCIVNYASTQPGWVIESKLAIAVLKIDQLKLAVANPEIFTVPTLATLQTVDINEAARRVAQREGQSSPEKLLARRDRDFGRYGEMYTVDGQPLSHTDLLEFADIEIATDHLDTPDITGLMYLKYLEKATIAAQSEPVFATPIMDELKEVLKRKR